MTMTKIATGRKPLGTTTLSTLEKENTGKFYSHKRRMAISYIRWWGFSFNEGGRILAIHCSFFRPSHWLYMYLFVDIEPLLIWMRIIKRHRWAYRDLFIRWSAIICKGKKVSCKLKDHVNIKGL